jgi:hypothetical protein
MFLWLRRLLFEDASGYGKLAPTVKKTNAISWYDKYNVSSLLTSSNCPRNTILRSNPPSGCLPPSNANGQYLHHFSFLLLVHLSVLSYVYYSYFWFVLTTPSHSLHPFFSLRPGMRSSNFQSNLHSFSPHSINQPNDRPPLTAYTILKFTAIKEVAAFPALQSKNPPNIELTFPATAAQAKWQL